MAQSSSFSARVGVFFAMFSSESNSHNLILCQLGQGHCCHNFVVFATIISIQPCLAPSLYAANKVNSLYYLTTPLAR